MNWNITAILTVCIAFIESVPRLIASGVNIYEEVKRVSGILRKVRDEKRDPTDDEWAALNASLDADEKKLQTDDPPPADALAPVNEG